MYTNTKNTQRDVCVCVTIIKQKEAINLTVEKALEEGKGGLLKNDRIRKQEALCNSILFKTYFQTRAKF